MCEPGVMEDWNVVVTVRDHGYTRARRVLGRLGPVARTRFYNVLVMRTDDIPAFLEAVDDLLAEDPWLADDVSRILPLTQTFEFRDEADFERRARDVALAWLDRLAGRSFHVRLHGRGWNEETTRFDEERDLDEALLRALDAAGVPGRLTFDDADVVIDVETVGSRAGMALWTREDLERHPFLRVD